MRVPALDVVYHFAAGLLLVNLTTLSIKLCIKKSGGSLG